MTQSAPIHQLKVRLQSLTMSGGDVLPISPQGVTCIVGGNNVGKSTLLRDIEAFLGPEGHYAKPLALKGLSLHKDPLEDEHAARAYLDDHAFRLPQQPSRPQAYQSALGAAQTTAEQLMISYRDRTHGLGGVSNFFVWYATAGQLANSVVSGLGMIGEPMVGSPIARLYRDPSLEDELSQLARDTFGEPLVLDRVNGDVRLRVGDPGVEPPNFRWPSVEYANAVRDLTPLSEQGDGLKSFFGLALNVIANSAQILLIDEPEAFLHPSQAKALGRWLGQQAVGRDLQIIVATHDKDFVLGLVGAAEQADLSLVRLTRDGSATHATTIRHDKITATWNDAVLRYSNVLQGLFHSRVVITEADADCRFYGAVLDQLGNEEGMRPLVDDTLFVPGGGKQGIPAMAKALADLRVETFAIVDFDTLNNKRVLSAIVDAVGGSWSDKLQNLYVVVTNAVNATKGGLWDSLKKQGLAAMPPGDVYRAATDLLNALQEMRVLVVPVGEMEGLDRSIGLEKSAWVNAMLADNRHITCAEARSLLSPLLREVENSVRPAAPTTESDLPFS
ncbi:AAA family ATPase [Nocardioides sp. NPDC047086]|uniref:ATP-dependent nuclease n=1 Tax=Nocardioides sp. NPDC047086 TaxID=3154810 RepID=UPI0033FC01B3